MIQSFANRLQKVNRHISKWAKRQGITCFRVYDMDMPEFPFCIDKYEQYLHISEYKANHKMTDEEHDDWLYDCMDTISIILEVPREDIYLKERRRLSRRTEQYEKVSLESKMMIAQEQELKFHVNLTDYLDTGLFLDHRPLRKIFREESKDKNVLNLFSYTGAFSVYAADGGAKAVTTVDLSKTYLQWTQENLELNGLMNDTHKIIQSDVMLFLKQEPTELYDLVFVDPPAFSNSKRLKGTWDTQRDHATMLFYILKLVKPGGTIYFSNNLRGFEPQFETLKASSIKDISVQTVPEDFRNKQIHHCYKIIK